MKVTIDGITYEGTVEEIRRIVENPPNYGGNKINYPYPLIPVPYVPPFPDWPEDFPRNWDGSPRVTCCI